MNNPCPSCAIAEANPDTAHQHAGCKSCAVRALAQSPTFHTAGLDGGDQKPYRKALALIFGDSWREGHDQVLQWRDRIKAWRAA